MSVLFRVNAGARTGLGHLQRCLSLASALRERGTSSVFLTNDERATLERVAQFGFESRPLSAASWKLEDADETAAAAKASSCGTVVVDSDEEGEPFLARLRDAGLFVCAVEDNVPHDFPCQLLVNGDAHAKQLTYHSSSGDTRFLLGPEYSMLRQEFWQVPARVARAECRNVLVMLGGDDPNRLMTGILRELDSLPGAFTVTAVIGPFFASQDELKEETGRLRRRVRLVYAPASVRDLMLEADLAVSAGGQTLYELARVGCPVVAIRTVANQAGQMEAFVQAGVIRSAGRAEDPGVLQAMRDAVNALLADPGARGAMSAAGQRMIDGQGAIRVAEELLRVNGASTAEGSARLRRATPQDARLLWQWANDPEVRRQAFDSAPIPWESHAAWYAGKLGDTRSLLSILEMPDGTPIGQIRFDQRSDGLEVDLSVSPTHRGRGIGCLLITRGLQAAAQRWPAGTTIMAKVLDGNQSSRRVFEASGFVAKGTRTFNEKAYHQLERTL